MITKPTVFGMKTKMNTFRRHQDRLNHISGTKQMKIRKTQSTTNQYSDRN